MKKLGIRLVLPGYGNIDGRIKVFSNPTVVQSISERVREVVEYGGGWIEIERRDYKPFLNGEQTPETWYVWKPVLINLQHFATVEALPELDEPDEEDKLRETIKADLAEDADRASEAWLERHQDSSDRSEE